MYMYVHVYTGMYVGVCVCVRTHACTVAYDVRYGSTCLCHSLQTTNSVDLYASFFPPLPWCPYSVLLHFEAWSNPRYAFPLASSSKKSSSSPEQRGMYTAVHIRVCMHTVTEMSLRAYTVLCHISERQTMVSIIM